MPRSRKHDGVVFRRKESSLVDSLPRPEWKSSEGIDLHRRLARSPEETTRTTSGQRQQRPRCCTKRGNLEFWTMGGFFLGELFQAADASGKDARDKPARRETPQECFRDRAACGNHCGSISRCILRDRLRQRVRIRTSLGLSEKGVLKPATVHQELRVLRRMLNVAVRKKLLPANPCSGVEFPVASEGTVPTALC